MGFRDGADSSYHRNNHRKIDDLYTEKDRLELHQLIVQHMKDKECALSVENNLHLEKLILEHLNNTGELI